VVFLTLKVFPKMGLFETTEDDVKYDQDLLVPMTRKRSLGVRVVIIYPWGFWGLMISRAAIQCLKSVEELIWNCPSMLRSEQVAAMLSSRLFASWHQEHIDSTYIEFRDAAPLAISTVFSLFILPPDLVLLLRRKVVGWDQKDVDLTISA
jgi:hypothetical protein